MDDFISRLMSEERKKWQNPERIVELAGIKEGMHVADIGSGPGFFTVPIARKVGMKGVVYAVEKERDMIVYLKKRIKQEGLEKTVRIVNLPAERTSLASSSIDLVFMANVFHDINDHKALLKELNRILKDNGTVVNIDWKKRFTSQGPPLQLRISMKEEVSIFERSGFRLVKRIKVGPYHYGFVLAKQP